MTKLKPTRRIRVSFTAGALQDFAVVTTVKAVREGLFCKELIDSAANSLLNTLEAMSATSYEKAGSQFAGRSYTFCDIPDFSMEIMLLP
jgi:hypothetical protein